VTTAEAGPGGRPNARLLVATGNPGKVRELGAILAGLPVELVGLNDLRATVGRAPEVPETGTTFLANARIKAHAYATWSGLAAVADDSGLEVDALGGAPGVLSARYAGPGASDADNLAKLLRELAPVPPERRAARFRCAAVLALPGGAANPRAAAGGALHLPGAAGSEWSAEAAWEGRILQVPRGTGGFGYDPVFLPDGWRLTSAEVDAATKNAASHRARAFSALRPAIEAWAQGAGRDA
jgi:XTP/dITP diphosphohydrolase